MQKNVTEMLSGTEPAAFVMPFYLDGSGEGRKTPDFRPGMQSPSPITFALHSSDINTFSAD